MNEFELKYASFDDADDSVWFSRLRHWRNEELAKTDYLMISDVPADKDAWAQYRQDLRDLPSNTIDPKKPKLPIKP